MKIVDPSIEVFFFVPEDGSTVQQMIERAARNCYQSEGMIDDGTDASLIRKILGRGHHAMLEFGYAMAKIIADRGLTHELVRHRLASFAQESTRWCNYGKGKFGSQIVVVRQPGLDPPASFIWEDAMRDAERRYLALIEQRVSAQLARSVLPIGLKSEIWIGANTREWRHIFKMRCAKDAHPIIRGVMLTALEKFNQKHPAIYGDQYEEFILSAK